VGGKYWAETAPRRPGPKRINCDNPRITSDVLAGKAYKLRSLEPGIGMGLHLVELAELPVAHKALFWKGRWHDQMLPPRILQLLRLFALAGLSLDRQLGDSWAIYFLKGTEFS
jgi:hypothetical protein